jgi:D-alanyl-D-alanine carboxypeptidase
MPGGLNPASKRQGRKIRRSLSILICFVLLLSGGKLLLKQADLNLADYKPLIELVNINLLGRVNTEAALLNGKQDKDWNLILVNHWNYIPDDYQMVLVRLANGESVDARIYPDLLAMFNAARAHGVDPVVVSGYRSPEDQKSLMMKKINEYQTQGYSAVEAQALAEKWVALPGTSEHQLGMAVDINPARDQAKADQLYEWLNHNSYKYGFILRYPAEKTEITGTIYEPWHYRYVGKEAAAEIYARGLCLEEYLEELAVSKSNYN